MEMKCHSKNNISYYMGVCFKNDVKVYPIQYEKTTHHLIQVSDKNKKHITYDKVLKSSEELNEALKKTYIFLGKKLLN